MSKNISKIIYINLNRRTDRKEDIVKELDSFNLDYERFEAIETTGFGIVGCGLSHLNVLKIAKQRKYENILILEDDFTFLITKEEFEKNLDDFFSLNIPYDVCMLSYNLQQHKDTSYAVVNKVIEAQTASGYIVHNSYYDKLINLYEWAIPLLESTRMHWVYANDQIWKQFQKQDNWYYFKTRIGKQRAGYSDNANAYIEYDS
jgi:GR25 family glycosyltransferase involved in LPS biosynthesis